MRKVAFITGGNGITGSAILEYLVKTSPQEWSSIIVTSRSSFQTTISDPRIKFIALDFSEDVKILVSKMKGDCVEVTHAYFSSYIHRDNFTELNSVNSALFGNFLEALTQVSAKLENVTLQTGGKHYNSHLYPVPSPSREADPRLEASIDNFYYQQEDALLAAQKGQKWSWNVIRPDAIVGHTSKPNGMNSALTFALYFLVCQELEQEAKMPTNQIYWDGYDDASDSRLVADLTIYASTHQKCRNEAFNVANGDYFTWKYMWPRLAEYCGAKASSDQVFTKAFPKIGSCQQEFSLAEWAKDKRGVWDGICDKAGMPDMRATWDAGTWGYQDWVFQRTWSGTASINKAREYGWPGHIDSFRSYTEAFETFEKMGQIPCCRWVSEPGFSEEPIPTRATG